MTTEYVHRIVEALTKYEVSYVVTGGASEFIRQNKKITLDFDILLEEDISNYSKIDELIKHFNHDGIASKSLEKGKIVRLSVFPFKVDVLPRLNGLETDKVIREKELFHFQGMIIPLISKRNLKINYQNIRRNE